MCPSAPRVCSEPGGQRPVLSLSLDLIRFFFVFFFFSFVKTWVWSKMAVKTWFKILAWPWIYLFLTRECAKMPIFQAWNYDLNLIFFVIQTLRSLPGTMWKLSKCYVSIKTVVRILWIYDFSRIFVECTFVRKHILLYFNSILGLHLQTWGQNNYRILISIRTSLSPTDDREINISSNISFLQVFI